MWILLGCVSAVIILDKPRHSLDSCFGKVKIVCLFIVLSGQSSDSPFGPRGLLGRAQVTASLSETQNACGEDVRLLITPLGLTKKQTSEKQEPNISHGH
jgi:hypothetical protein